MMSVVTRLIVILCAISQLAAAAPEQKMRMSKQEVIAVGRRAIDARFPWAAAKNYSYDALILNDGVWGVYVPRRGLRGGGDPNAEVRDSDGKVLKVYLAR